ncbi:hypothetical protein WI664_10355 [Vibrio cholerae]
MTENALRVACDVQSRNQVMTQRPDAFLSDDDEEAVGTGGTIATLDRYVCWFYETAEAVS